MTKPKKRLVKTKVEEQKKEVLIYVKLVNIVRQSRKKEKVDEAFEEIVRMLDDKIKMISHKFTIPGCSFYDIYQEALYALRFKAIKDYDQSRSNLKEVSPFDKFAALCIRRHLSTKRKASFQNKSRVLNSSISLDQNRNTSNNSDELFLSDILASHDLDASSKLNKKEYYKKLFSKLYSKLSVFEKEVFILYCRRYSYDEITNFINNKKKYNINMKSVDNALSRIKGKAIQVFLKSEKE